jgi:hypothetical protein
MVEGELVRMYCEWQVGKLMLGIWVAFLRYLAQHLFRVFLAGRRPLERPRRRWEDNIKMDLREVGWGAQTGLMWLRIGTGGGLLCIR